MEFRLIYQGALPSSGNANRHPKEKHQIRKQIHKQLATLWDVHPLLKTLHRPERTWNKKTFVEEFGHEKYGFNFLALVNERLDQICALDILLLRREPPGSLIMQSGDIDNRLKTLFDALSIPDDKSKLTPPELDENPFFCLMEKDKLVSQVAVTADRLLSPVVDSEPRNYVHAIIKVKVQIAMEFRWGGLTYYRH